METGLQYFAAFVIGFSAFHLICKAAALIEKMSGNRGKDQSLAKSARPKRDDWYMFFHRSDLTGSKPAKDSKIVPSDKVDSHRRSGRRKRPESRAYLS
jgi:hypothetical protein